MIVVKKKDNKRDRGVAAGANLGLIATVVAAVRGWFAERRHQRELARRKRERRMKMARFAIRAARIAAYFIPIVIALVKSAGLISKIRGKKQKEEPEQEEDDIGIEVIQSEPVSSEEEVYERVNSEAGDSENPET
ncbi:MAG: hypothetical protein LUH18_08780 [Oscillospiraceae bacterium]|nr:hypothetical protein [Oscillospiraceae bacterium]